MPFQRTGHRIKFNHSNALPRYILSISVDRVKEQNDVSGKYFSWRYQSATLTSGRLVRDKIIGRKQATFKTADSLWRAIFEYTRCNYTTWLVGHNVLSDLILAGLPMRFTCGDMTIDRPRSKRTRENNDEDDPFSSALAVLEAPPTIIGCRVGQTQGRLVIVDVGNWFPGSISALEAACGLVSHVTYNNGDSNDDNGPASRVHSFNVHKIFEGLISFVRENKLGMFRYTASAQAMSAYRHCRMEHAIYVHDNLPIMQLERKAYFGGRSEAFKMGNFDETVYQLDVNALFPSVMQRYWFPYYLHRYEIRQELLTMLPAIDWSAAVADVELNTDKPIYPVRTDRHIIYPTGRFVTTLCGDELHRAFTSGHIRKCGSWSEYNMAQLFKLFVTEFWDMRQRFKTEGNVLYEQFTKRIMNSLYGKFAQLTPNWVNVNNDLSMLPFTTESRLDHATNEWTTHRSVGWQVQKLCQRKERTGSFYAIAAFVTAAARARMDYLRLASCKFNTFYQGVDSIIVNKLGLQNLRDVGEVSDTEIGKLRIIAESDYGYIHGVGDYAIGSKQVLSSRALHSEVTEWGTVQQHKYYVMEHLFRNGPIDHIEERLVDWTAGNRYTKGEVQPDGWVAPFELGGKPISASDGSNASDAAASANCVTTT